MYKSIGYHTRLYSDNTVKVTGGSFGKSGETDGSISQQTIERLVKSHFTVTVKPSGTLVFVDKEGREVSLYISVDASQTEAGKAAIKAYNEANMKAWYEQEAREMAASEEIENLMGGLSNEEIIKRLKGGDDMYILTTWYGKKLCAGEYNKCYYEKIKRFPQGFRLYEVLKGQVVFITGKA